MNIRIRCLGAIMRTPRLGTPPPNESITPSDLVPPEADTARRDVREPPAGEGLVPG
jgi:hypothetical protein